jgi:hypothetical protein
MIERSSGMIWIYQGATEEQKKANNRANEDGRSDVLDQHPRCRFPAKGSCRIV